jgi:hypothetical protein
MDHDGTATASLPCLMMMGEKFLHARQLQNEMNEEQTKKYKGRLCQC